jgi:hypothetical protein
MRCSLANQQAGSNYRGKHCGDPEWKQGGRFLNAKRAQVDTRRWQLCDRRRIAILDKNRTRLVGDRPGGVVNRRLGYECGLGKPGRGARRHGVQKSRTKKRAQLVIHYGMVGNRHGASVFHIVAVGYIRSATTGRDREAISHRAFVGDSNKSSA